MFTVKRFDDGSSSGAAGGGGAQQAQVGAGSAGNGGAASKLAALNARIAARRLQNAQQSQQEQQQQQQTEGRTPVAADASAVPAIHPSRLRIAPALRAKDANKPKTKAKQRYLKAKKERRKSRVKARPKGDKAKATASAATTASSALAATAGEADLTPSTEEAAAIALAWGQRKRAAEQTTKTTEEDSSSEASSSGSDSSERSDSDSDSDSDEDEDDGEDVPLPAAPLQPAEQLSGSDETGVLHRFPAPRSTLLPATSAILRAQGMPTGLSAPTVVNPALRATLGTSNKKAAKTNADGSEEDFEMIDAQEPERKRRRTSPESKADSTDVISPLISDWMRERLQQLGIKEWFAVQTSVIPLLLPNPKPASPFYPFGRPAQTPRDLLVAASTGSGKTLAYIVPLLEWLGRQPVPAYQEEKNPILAAFTEKTGPTLRRLRALIVLPTRDLVSQVGETVQLLAKGLDVKIGLAGVSGGGGSLFSSNHSAEGGGVSSVSGSATFALEQERLVDLPALKDRERGIFAQESTAWWSTILQPPREGTQPLPPPSDAYQSKIDILITTPGRLVDHLTYTPGFTLEHLRWLIMDEADRLLAQSFGGWREKVWEALRPKPSGGSSRKGMRAPAWLQAEALARNPAAPVSLFSTDERPYLSEASQVQKVLFSATLTRDPGMLEALELRRPLFVTVREKKGGSGPEADGDENGDEDAEDAIDDKSFALPEQLKEHVLITKDVPKPLALLQLLLSPRFDMLSLQPALTAGPAASVDTPKKKRKSIQPTLAQDVTDDETGGGRGVLVFTKSVEAARRLVRLLELFRDEHGAREVKRLVLRHYSSEMRVGERRKVLQAFGAGEVNVLVASDLIARGIDLPTVSHVISYDVPVDMGKYVHRVGRTARAGRRGNAWALVEEHEARHFRNMMEGSRGKSASRSRMEKVKLVREEWAGLEPAYQSALQRLAAEFSNR